MAQLPEEYRSIVPFTTLRPSQQKALDAGLLDGKSLLVATPTASGKTLIAILGFIRATKLGMKAIYVAPLKALAGEKAREFTKYPFSSTLSVGDYDDNDVSLSQYDVIITTPEKLDSLLRHATPWLGKVGCIVIDEIHLLGDNHRGPTLEILVTLLRQVLPNTQFIALSATVQNSQELANWLGAQLIYDTWRPVALKEAIHTPDGVLYKADKK
jgi:helicase